MDDLNNEMYVQTKFKNRTHCEYLRSGSKLRPQQCTKYTPHVIHEQVTRLPRKTRATLSEYCRLLNSYNMHRIDTQIGNVCMARGRTPHATRYLYERFKNPTQLSVTSLWANPLVAATFHHLKIECDE